MSCFYHPTWGELCSQLSAVIYWAYVNPIFVFLTPQSALQLRPEWWRGWHVLLLNLYLQEEFASPNCFFLNHILWGEGGSPVGWSDGRTGRVRIINLQYIPEINSCLSHNSSQRQISSGNSAQTSLPPVRIIIFLCGRGLLEWKCGTSDMLIEIGCVFTSFLQLIKPLFCY